MSGHGKGHALAVAAAGATVIAGVCLAEPVFPLLRELACDEELPSPYGVTLTAYGQEQSYSLSALTLIPLDDKATESLRGLLQVSPLQMKALPALPPRPDPGTIVLPEIPRSLATPYLLGTIGIDNRLREFNLQADLWALPFLNVFALAGQIEGRTRVDLTQLAGTKLLIEYDGFVYGVGAVACYAVRSVFANLNATLTQTELSTSSSTVGAWVLMPQLGVKIPWGAVWVGAMYQQADETHEGVIGGEQHGHAYYDASLEDKEPWNCLGGVRLDLPQDWHVDLQAGLGDRENLQASVSRRF
jgi:hypothetical protein